MPSLRTQIATFATGTGLLAAGFAPIPFSDVLLVAGSSLAALGYGFVFLEWKEKGSVRATKSKLSKIGRRLGETSAKEEILFLFQRINPGTVFRYIQLWSGHFDAFEHSFDGRKHYFTIHHDVNLNFSVFAKEYVSSMIQNTLARPAQFESMSPSSVSFNFEA